MTASGGRPRQATWYPGLIGFAVGALLVGLLVPSSIEGDDETTARTGTDASSAPLPRLDHGTEVAGSSGGAGNPGAAGAAPGATGHGAAASKSSLAPAGRVSGTERPPLTATDQGVSSSTIKVAFLLLDLGSTGRIGVNTTGVDPQQQQRAFEAYVEDINRRGGINGRRIEPSFRVFDTLSPDDQRAACLAVTEDVKAFAVIAMPGYANDAVLCVTEQHRTPLVVVGQAVSREFYDRSQGRLVTIQSAGDRMMRNWAAELDAARQLHKRTLGIVASETKNSRDTIDGALVPALEGAGHDVAHITRFSNDQSIAATQTPTAVQQMRAAGVDTVLLVNSFLQTTPFVQTAEQQGWRPRWLVSEFAGGTSDFEVQGMPESFDGALAMTSARFGEWRAGVPEPAIDVRCRELYEKATGESLPRSRDGRTTNAAYPTLMSACGMIRILAAAATAAGPELTRDRLVAATQGLGVVDAPHRFPGSFRPGKTDLADMARFNRYDAGCKCWQNLTEPSQATFR